MRFLLFTVLFVRLCSTAYSQVTQPARWEVECKFTDDEYSVVSLREEGLALIRDLDKMEGGKRAWEVVILDTALQHRWTKQVFLHTDLRFTGYEYLPPGKLNIMFRRNETESLKAEMFMIDLSTQSIEESDTDVRLQFRLTYYTVVGGNHVFGGYVNREPVLVIHDPIKDNSLIVPGFFLADTELMDVRPNRNNTFNILLFQRAQSEKKIIFRTIDKLGNILVEDVIPVEEDKVIINAATSVLEHDEVLIAGSYGYNNSKQASGIFSCLIDPFSEQPVQYTEFYQFNHFLDYLPQKKINKIKEKATDRLSYGKPPEFRTSVSIHRIEEFKNGFALFGESFIATAGSTSAMANPYYSTMTRTSPYGNPYGYTPFANRYYNNPYQYTTTVAEELRMLHAFVIAYGFNGTRLWDYSIPLEEIRIGARDQVADFTIVNNIPNFLYKAKDEMMFSNHNTDTSRVIKAKPIPIKLNNEHEEARGRDELSGNVRHWFGPYLYVWGIQAIEDKNRHYFDKSRRVFFVNKIKVD